MKNLFFSAVIVTIMAMSVPAVAGGIFDDSGDLGHFIAGMIVQEMREDAKHEEELAEQRRQEQLENRSPYETGSSQSKMRRLFRVHNLILDEVLEESPEATDLVLDIYEDNDYGLQQTANDIRPFVYEYFEVFHRDQREMYNLWVETRLEDWLESYFY